jgi:hypothetical protein
VRASAAWPVASLTFASSRCAHRVLVLAGQERLERGAALAKSPVSSCTRERSRACLSLPVTLVSSAIAVL